MSKVKKLTGWRRDNKKRRFVDHTKPKAVYIPPIAYSTIERRNRRTITKNNLNDETVEGLKLMRRDDG